MKRLFTIFTILAAVMLVSSCQKDLPDNLKNVDVSQGGKTPTPTPTPTTELKVSEPGQFGAKGGQQTITITASETWTLTKSAESDWLNVKTVSGKAGTTQVDLEAAENTLTKPRSATITVLSGNLTKDVEVSQSAASSEISLSVDNLNFSSGGDSQSFSIKSNIAWTVTSSQDWCSVNPTSGSNDSSVTVSVEENTSTAERMATITVKSDAGDKTISVTQSGVAVVLTLDVSSMEFASGSGSKMFRISSNTIWAISSDKNWCSVSPTSGNGDGSVTVSVEENTSTSERTATITVESATITRTLVVTQNGAKPVTPPASQDRTFTVGGVTFKMIAVDGGTFTMGATSEQGSDAYDYEKPAHQVTLSSYYIGETEVTQELWQAVMGSNPSDFSGSRKPVENVSWDDCQEFIRKLNSLTGQNFRLPTEAEWEFAARGGNQSRGNKYAGSNTIDNVAWYYKNSYAKGSSSSDYGTHNVATKQSNELGLYDMSGNVLEWCQDWYGNYSSSSQTNPMGPSSGSYRVGRGGSWILNARSCRVSLRIDYSPGNRNSYLGLRLAL